MQIVRHSSGIPAFARGGVVTIGNFDGVHLGQFDLSLSLGVPGQTDHPMIADGIDRMLKASAAHGKFAACMAPSVEIGRAWMAKGFRMVSFGYDAGLLSGALSTGLAALKA